ncbi:MAG: OsmC family protein [Verrucomicrobiales bacterium]|jgi:hypothetical protein|nr:OsmC family protein [Verrucomicrobiales bacterium]HQZ29713.1 OsmC family protein [Verrucomicrobiales bacterium]
MDDLLQRALVNVRVTAELSGGVTIYARTHQLGIGKGWSFDIAEGQITGAETMLGVLASDILGIFVRLARERRLPVDEVEARLTAQLAAPLALLGVVGASGEPYYERVQMRAYVGSGVSPDRIREVWDEALKRAPFYNTLRRGTEVEIIMQISA